MPTATDLVTDLPADFEVFGQAVDTDFIDLLGGTTGQGDITGVTAGTGITVTSPTGPVPTVAINTAVTADLTTAQTLTNKTLTSPALTTPTISTLTTNGDLLYGTGSGALARRGIGSTGNVLTVSGGLPVWAAPAGGGKILQVVQGTTTTSTTIASTTYTDTTLTATITPSAATSKILCLVSQNFQNQRSSSSADGGSSIKLLRGATDIVVRGAQEVDWLYNIASVTSSNTNFAMVTNIMYVDSPSTTSATTYKTQGSVRFTANSNQVTYQTSSSQSQIILLEIGA